MNCEVDKMSTEIDETDEEMVFDPELQVAYCKYCYTTHDRWETKVDDAWECHICSHRTHIDYLKIFNLILVKMR